MREGNKDRERWKEGYSEVKIQSLNGQNSLPSPAMTLMTGYVNMSFVAGRNRC